MITEKVFEKNCQLIIIGGTEYHIHVLINNNPVINVSNLIKEIKGYSSFTIANSVCPGTFFKWQSGCGALSVSPREVSRVSKYIADQKLHHKEDSAIGKWEV
ncbi:MAG: transposase [Anaerolineales bacterium]|nr:transposase [Anaerolineales bacterium]